MQVEERIPRKKALNQRTIKKINILIRCRKIKKDQCQKRTAIKTK